MLAVTICSRPPIEKEIHVMNTTLRTLSMIVLLIPCSIVWADPIPEITRRLPPAGIELSAADRARIESGLEQLKKRLAVTPDDRLQADVEIYAKAVDYALQFDEFYDAKEIPRADSALKKASERLDELVGGKSSWTKQRGLVVRGYYSSIDGSPQPYGLVIPENLDLDKPAPLYVWLHGRGDKTTDLHFIHQRQTSVGQIAPPGAIVLHPHGRQCVGYKSAGEIDVLEAIEHVKSQYKIDADRIVLMGFSMGGAGAWHLGAHYADRWVAMSPGAGFAETARYQKLKPEDFPPAYEQTLWGLYDVPGYARNLFNLTVVAYSGEIDPQMQAATVMEEAFAANDHKLTHLIGPGMGHKYHPDSLKDILQRMHAAVEKGLDRNPAQVSLQTRTLRYNRVHWVEVLALEEHWRDTRVDATVSSPTSVSMTTRNVTELLLHDWQRRANATITIDGQSVTVPAKEKLSPGMTLLKRDGRWGWQLSKASDDGLAKRHGLQGPIDDVFLAPFLVILPSGQSKHAAVQQWVDFEAAHFQDRWRALMRGEPRVKRDTEITPEDIQQNNLILWGDADSNQLIKKVVAKLPIRWTSEAVQVNDKSFAAAHHVPALIYPNPLNPRKYVVLNSGLTFREDHDRTNSLQNPKLPDWAVIDITQPPNGTSPGRIVAADFFDEQWQVKNSQ
jgi:dienelactone hydrolase